MKTTHADHGDTTPGALGPVVGRTSNDVWRDELAKKVAARHAQPKGQIVTGPDGKLSTNIESPPPEGCWPFPTNMKP